MPDYTTTPFAEITIDAVGWSPQAESYLSPNHDTRPADTAISLLVIHNISLPPGQYGDSYIRDFFLNTLDFDAHPYFEHLREIKVSSHFLILRNGRLCQFVSVDDRAWHAGSSCFQERERCNDFSVGIEMEGSDFEPFTDIQYNILSKLTGALCVRYPIRAITGHQQIAPGRKTDPGPYFDWKRYELLCQRGKIAGQVPEFFS